MTKPTKPTTKADKPTWATIKARADEIITAAAPNAKFRPSCTRGLVKVHALGIYIKAADLAAYHAARREAAILQAGYLSRHYAEAFVSEIAAAGGDEATALSAMGINYHDDRGDECLYAVNMRPQHLAAWIAAAAAAGVKSRVRPA